MKKKKVGIIAGSLVAGVLIVVLVFAGGQKRAAAAAVADEKMHMQAAPRPVTVDRVTRHSASVLRTYPGVVCASEESALSFRVGGPLTQVKVTLGEPVKQGSLLMQIDPRDFEDGILSLEAQWSGATARLKNARKEYERAEQLLAEKVIAQADYDRALSALDGADATVKNLNAQLQIARHSLADTTLVAPSDGAVTALLAENYEMVKVGSVVLRFHNTRKLEVTVNMPENEMVERDMNAAKPALVSFPAVPGKTFVAHLKEWSSDADAITRTYPVTFEFEAPEALTILPGMSARISWENGTVPSPLTVPVSAIAPDEKGGSTLWVFDADKGQAEQRTVQTGGLSGSDRVIVISGVSEGEQVVVSGSRLIYAGRALVATDI